MIELQSARSMRVSLEAIKRGDGGLDAHRAEMLKRAPDPGDWAIFPPEHLEMKDLAYLTAASGHEFAILRGKREDILFHGDSQRCEFDAELADRLLNKRLRLFGHSHPGEDEPVPSPQDRRTLKEIGQVESRLISGLSGREITFTSDLFELL